MPSARAAAAPALRRVCALAPAVLALTVGLLVARVAWPAPANAADLFPVDDWLGDGLKKAGDVVLGPLKLGAKEIAALLATIVGALADLLVPKSLVKAGLGGIKWLVQLPPVGVDATPQPGVPTVRMPHLQQLRDTMTWIGVTLLPLGLVLAAGRAFLAPTTDGDSPAEILGRVITAGVGLVVYDWAWGVVTELSRLLTSGLLGLPWVADGVERMLETLVIGGASGSAVASEFVIPLLVLVAGATLLGLLLLRVGLEVATALLYVLGGLALGLSVTGFGRRLLSAWLLAAGAILLLPLLWSAVFVTGAALMLDAGDTGGHGGFASFVAQLYNVAAALAVFAIAIKLAQLTFKSAGGAIGGLVATPTTSGGGAAAPRGSAGAGRLQALAQNATPAGLARFSSSLRGGLRGAASYPGRHPVRSAQAVSYPLRRPVQATREAAAGLSTALAATGARGASAGQRAAGWYERERTGGRFSAQAADARANARSQPRAGAAAGSTGRNDAVREEPRPAAGTRPRPQSAPAAGTPPGPTRRAAGSAAPAPPPAGGTPPSASGGSPTGPPGREDRPRSAAVTPPPAGAGELGGRLARPWWSRVIRPARTNRDRKDQR
jgi:hypothetical protein